MEKLQLDGLGTVEMNTEEKLTLSGGYGSYPGYDYKTASAVGEAFWAGVGRFTDGVANGIKNALNNCAC